MLIWSSQGGFSSILPPHHSLIIRISIIRHCSGRVNSAAAVEGRGRPLGGIHSGTIDRLVGCIGEGISILQNAIKPSSHKSKIQSERIEINMIIIPIRP